MDTNNGAPAADTTQEILVAVILDRSGSMESCQTTTISGYNEYINALKMDSKAKYSVTLTQFDAPVDGPELTVSYEDKPVAEVPKLTTKTYQPRGGTPLYDAIGECVRRVNPNGRGIIIAIITDGAENASREFTNKGVKTLIEEKKKEGWVFAFLGADIDSFANGGAIGVAAANISNYTRGNEQKMYANLASSTMSYSSNARSMGVRAASLRAFFDDDQRKDMQDLTTTTPSKGNLNNAGQPTIQKPATKTGKRTDWSVKS